ncbi:general stress protein [Rathayibacter soli]|uniref:general stress protein n=1 Tax=Rathayibacter soli TaxID=3144168 RepID=UPI0027E3F5C8|nr:general stress protein [Glaciibacter superstes]
MSNQNPMGGRRRGVFPTLPSGEAIATYQTYPEAQQAVDVLARADFPVNRVSIVGSDLKSVERVTGKLSWGRVAIAGAASGAWLGLFFGLLLVIFSPATSLGFIIAALLIGAGFGMMFGLASYTLNRRRRDYTSMTQVMATSYSVLVESDLVNRARNVLSGGSGLNGEEHPREHRHSHEPAHPSDPPAAFVPPAAHPSDPPPARPRYGENPAPRYGENPEPRYGENPEPDDDGHTGDSAKR